MNIELKNIQHVARMSEETECFTASLYIDGVPSGTVSNHGTGGPHNFSDHAAERRLNDFGKTKPWFVYEGKQHYHSAESLVGEVLVAWLKGKEAKKEQANFKRDLGCRLMYTKKGERGIFQTGKVAPANLQAWLNNEAAIRAKTPGMDVILNKLSFDKAWPIYDANIQRVAR